MISLKKIYPFLSNYAYLVTSNLLTIIVSILMILVLPKVIGVTEYSFWQLYLFYVSYVGIFHFGWIDGIYLKYGGSIYSQLDHKKFYSQIVSLSFSQVVIAAILFSLTYFYELGEDRVFIFLMLAGVLVMTNIRYLFIYILQATNKIKESSFISFLDRGLYIVLLISLIVAGVDNYKLIILCDVIARFLSLIYAAYLCRHLLWHKLSFFHFDLAETLDNIKVGFNLMISNLASLLIIGIVRFGIEYKWSIQTFGKVSLMLSVSGFLMIFVNAVGIVLFPLLRNMTEDTRKSLYVKMSNIIFPLMLAGLFGYYPLIKGLEYWLPEYADSFKYLIFLLPLLVYEARMSLLNNTYAKALRLERMMLGINVIVMLVSLILTTLNVFFIQQLDLMMFAILFCIFLRCIIFDICVTKILNIFSLKHIALELLLIVIFIYSAWFLNWQWSLLIYAVSYICYLLILFLSQKLKNAAGY